jgi:hypothetical protein
MQQAARSSIHYSTGEIFPQRPPSWHVLESLPPGRGGCVSAPSQTDSSPSVGAPKRSQRTLVVLMWSATYNNPHYNLFGQCFLFLGFRLLFTSAVSEPWQARRSSSRLQRQSGASEQSNALVEYPASSQCQSVPAISAKPAVARCHRGIVWPIRTC